MWYNFVSGRIYHIFEALGGTDYEQYERQPRGFVRGGGKDGTILDKILLSLEYDNFGLSLFTVGSDHDIWHRGWPFQRHSLPMFRLSVLHT